MTNNITPTQSPLTTHNPTPLRPEGVTYLEVEAHASGDWIAHFSGRNGGAHEWQHLVDAFPEAIDRVSELGFAGEVQALDQGRLGRGARLRMGPDIFHLVVALWLEDASVRAALERHALRITGRPLGPPAWIALATKLLQRVRLDDRADLEPPAASPTVDGASEIALDEVEGASVEKNDEPIASLAEDKEDGNE